MPYNWFDFIFYVAVLTAIGSYLVVKVVGWIDRLTWRLWGW